jgi:hypothetical protein
MTTQCPDLGRLRSWLDGEAAPADDTLTEHTADCDACQTALGALQTDADFADHTLATSLTAAPSAQETEMALGRLHLTLALSEVEPSMQTAAASFTAGDLSLETAVEPELRTLTPALSQQERASHPRRIPMPITAVWQRWRLAIGGLAAAMAVTLALATPEGQAMAATFLAQFRSQRLAIVTFNPDQTRQTGLFRMERLGTVQNRQPQRPAEVANVQEAASKAGFPVLQPDPATLPAGAAKTPKVRFSPASETRLTFDKQKTREYFDSINRKDLSLPDKLQGSTLVVALPPIVMLEYASAGSDNKPSVMIGQAREIQVGVEGAASLDEVRTFMLGLPDLPPELAQQLRSIKDWTSTLPIPIPVDKVTWQETTIAGSQAYILNDNTGLGSGVIWQRDGRILGVAGPMKATDLRKVAESLR